jgi:TRAP-type C4-dicarboxylate transport system permease small subunit
VTPEGGGEHISWWRAIASALCILVTGLALAVGGANYVLTNLTSLSRDNRQYVASLIFFAVVIGLAFALRRLQRRGLI